MIPKNKNIFEVPDGYFEKLPDEIIAKAEIKTTQVTHLIRFGAAAASLIAILALAILFVDRPNPANDSLEANMQPEIELYISSGYWEAEDILTLTEYPDELLEEIIQTEWSTQDASDLEQEEIWF